MKTDTKTILITGAAAGLGRDLALAMAKRGWRIATVNIDDAK
jgi:NAD(P)-dependent dehydrogenase (short-subunit alcohol dehydrogenase family)